MNRRHFISTTLSIGVLAVPLAVLPFIVKKDCHERRSAGHVVRFSKEPDVPVCFCCRRKQHVCSILRTH